MWGLKADLVASGSHLCCVRSPTSSSLSASLPLSPGSSLGLKPAKAFLCLSFWLRSRGAAGNIVSITVNANVLRTVLLPTFRAFENGMKSMVELSGRCIPYRMTFPQQQKGGMGGGLGNKDACLFLRALAQCIFRSDPTGQNDSQIIRLNDSESRSRSDDFCFIFDQTCFFPAKKLPEGDSLYKLLEFHSSQSNDFGFEK